MGSINCKLSISIEISGFRFESKELAEIINLRPTTTHLKGEVFFVGPEHNKIKKEFKDNLWIYSLEFTLQEEMWPQKVIDQFFEEILFPREDGFKKLRLGAKMNLCIAIHYYNILNPTFHFREDQLQFLAKTGTELDIDQYCWKEKPME